MRIEEVFYEDERVVSMLSRLKFPEDCNLVPARPGVCLVECPDGMRKAFASSNLSASLALSSAPKNGTQAGQEIAVLDLPAHGMLHFFTTSDLKDAEALKESILERFMF